MFILFTPGGGGYGHTDEQDTEDQIPSKRRREKETWRSTDIMRSDNNFSSQLIYTVIRKKQGMENVLKK